jgi:hypothetical protein
MCYSKLQSLYTSRILLRHMFYAQREKAATRLSEQFDCVPGSDSRLAAERVRKHCCAGRWCFGGLEFHCCRFLFALRDVCALTWVVCRAFVAMYALNNAMALLKFICLILLISGTWLAWLQSVPSSISRCIYAVLALYSIE